LQNIINYGKADQLVQIEEPIFYKGSDPFVQSSGKQPANFQNFNDGYYPEISKLFNKESEPKKSLEDTNVFFMTEA
jgi:hypothetical protein